ncbi:MAG TPA: pilus assembly protein TadG-related protein [Anaerolineales bacterium]|nr:pilus assembly protein TadG-related protein [Anaerolineales bacterium]
MPKIIRNAKKKLSRMERGQVLVVVAVAAVGIIAIIGLVMDVGLLFIGNSRLRRAVDAAAIAAALQYRQGYDINTLTNAADEFLEFNTNNFGLSNATSAVNDCDTDSSLCTTPRRKIVRVDATASVDLAFLPVIGIDSVPISATATSETASVDVVLAIDRSESMTYGDPLYNPDGTVQRDANNNVITTHPPGDPMRDPDYCNDSSKNGLTDTYTSPINGKSYTLTTSCEPFNKVVGAAIDFTNVLFFPYDQMAIVTFDKEAGVPVNGQQVPNLSFSDDCPYGITNCTVDDAVTKALKQLTVYGGVSPYQTASSITDDYRCYSQLDLQCAGSVYNACAGSEKIGSQTNYLGLIGQKQDPCLGAPNYLYTKPYDPSHYTTTNIGYGLEMAGNELAADTRQNVLWVVILLTDGVPNSGHSDDSSHYYCPQSTWANMDDKNNRLPVCVVRSNLARNYYPYNPNKPTTTRLLNTDDNYDALAYAYDEADFVGVPYNPLTNTGGQGALLYTIGLGGELQNYPVTNPVTGASEFLGPEFLKYAANVGNGLYYAAPTASQLTTIFRSIGSNIAVRLSK